jgi:hypothetical protein
VTDRSETDVSIPNLAEYHIDGPSKFLPQGQLLTLLEVPRFSHCVRGSMTDRRDFYHQASVSPERARANMLPFHFPLERFEKTNAMTEFLTRTTAGLSCKREKIGDGFRHGLLPTSVAKVADHGMSGQGQGHAVSSIIGHLQCGRFVCHCPDVCCLGCQLGEVWSLIRSRET